MLMIRRPAGLMSDPTRIFKTLGWLAAAMTGTTALLGWIDPSAPIPSDLPSAARFVPLARALVIDGVSADLHAWNNVEILTGPSESAIGRLLSATTGPPSADFHFHVDHHGRPFRTHLWHTQQTLADSPLTVRIQVSNLGGGQPMSAVQRNSVRALVGALNEALARGDPALSVRLDDHWSATYDLEPGAPIEILSPRPSPE